MKEIILTLMLISGMYVAPVCAYITTITISLYIPIKIILKDKANFWKMILVVALISTFPFLLTSLLKYLYIPINDYYTYIIILLITYIVIIKFILNIKWLLATGISVICCFLYIYFLGYFFPIALNIFLAIFLDFLNLFC